MLCTATQTAVQFVRYFLYCAQNVTKKTAVTFI